jgi:DNA-directed RNA polymerase specialized sigma subunit
VTRPLTNRERLVMQLRYADGWTFEDMAKGIGVASATVRKSHLAAIRKMALSMRGDGKATNEPPS